MQCASPDLYVPLQTRTQPTSYSVVVCLQVAMNGCFAVLCCEGLMMSICSAGLVAVGRFCGGWRREGVQPSKVVVDLLLVVVVLVGWVVVCLLARSSCVDEGREECAVRTHVPTMIKCTCEQKVFISCPRNRLLPPNTHVRPSVRPSVHAGC